MVAAGALALASSYRATPDFTPSSLSVTTTQVTARHEPQNGPGGTGATTSASSTSGGQASTTGNEISSHHTTPDDARVAFDTVASR